MKKIKITIVLPSLKAGGAERVLSFVSQNLDKSKYHVTLLVLGFKKDSVYNIENVHTIFLNETRLLKALLGIIKYIIKARPDIMVSSVTHVNIIMALLSLVFYKTNFVAREASVISQISEHSKSIFSNKHLIKLLYPRFKKIICQSQDMLNDLKTTFKIKEHQLLVINNPITEMHPTKSMVNANGSMIKFITVGRLSKEKGHARILKSLAMLNYNFQYTIVGNGPLKSELEELVVKLGLKEKVNFINYTDKVSQKLSESDIFLQGSYVEGFPNAVLESCVVGTPVLAFNSPGGTKEIILNGVSGHLINTEKEWQNKLNNIGDLIKIEPKIISEHVKSKFSKDVILNQYAQLFTSLN